MNLAQSIRYHNPKTQQFTDEPRATASEALTGTDIMAALGMAQAEAAFGAALFFSKVGLSEQDKENAIQHLQRIAGVKAKRCKPLRELTGRPLALALRQIAKHVYDTYSRSAETPGARCKRCSGRAETVDLKRSKEQGQLVLKACKDCAGRGYTQVTTAGLQRGLKIMLPDLNQSAFSRHIKPLIDEMITLCYAEESRADAALNKAAR